MRTLAFLAILLFSFVAPESAQMGAPPWGTSIENDLGTLPRTLEHHDHALILLAPYEDLDGTVLTYVFGLEEHSFHLLSKVSPNSQYETYNLFAGQSMGALSGYTGNTGTADQISCEGDCICSSWIYVNASGIEMEQTVCTLFTAGSSSSTILMRHKRRVEEAQAIYPPKPGTGGS